MIRQMIGNRGVGIWKWIELSRAGKLNATAGPAVPTKLSMAKMEAENARLRRKLASTKLDLEIVKQAAGYFAKESR
jgi:transposase